MTGEGASQKGQSGPICENWPCLQWLGSQYLTLSPLRIPAFSRTALKTPFKVFIKFLATSSLATVPPQVPGGAGGMDITIEGGSA